MNKTQALSLRLKSPTHTSKSASKNTTPKGTTPKAKIDHHENLVNKMKSNRENLCLSLDHYTMVYQFGSPLRCLTHSQVFSFYCQQEQKLLCIHCVYEHKSSQKKSVIPVEEAYLHIQNDIQQMQHQIVDEIQAI